MDNAIHLMELADFRPISRFFAQNFFFNDAAHSEIYTLSLHDALPIWFSAKESSRVSPKSIGFTFLPLFSYFTENRIANIRNLQSEAIPAAQSSKSRSENQILDISRFRKSGSEKWENNGGNLVNRKY